MAKTPIRAHTPVGYSIARIVLTALLFVLGAAFLWKTLTSLFSPGKNSKEIVPMSQVSPNPTMKEKKPTPIKTETVSTEIPLNQEGFSEMLKDILENKPKDSTKAADSETIPTKDGTFTFKTPKGFTQSVDEKNHTVGYFLSHTSGEPNTDIVLMLVQPATVGIKDTGLYVLTTAFKREIFKDLLRLGTSYVLLQKTTVEPWNGFVRGMYTYAFESRLPKGAYKALDMLIYKNETSTDGLWIHIQMPTQAWETVFPKFLQSLETLKMEE